MDTEGFSNVEENTNHEQKIALLAILLSSTLIYNIVGQIDEYYEIRINYFQIIFKILIKLNKSD